MSTMTASTVLDPRLAVSPRRRTVLRAMYAANIVGAGLPGALMTFAPSWAMESMFGGAQDRIVFGVTGAVWLAIGLLSVAGLFRPLAFATVFVLQIVYKGIWVGAVALPMLAAGERTADVTPYAIFFGLVVGLWLLGVPFAALLSRR